MEILTVLSVVEIIISILLIIAIVMQQRGSGLGTMFGGSGGESYRSKRGAEAVLFNATVFLISLFIVVGLAIAIVSAQSGT